MYLIYNLPRRLGGASLPFGLRNENKKRARVNRANMLIVKTHNVTVTKSKIKQICGI